MNTDGQSGLAQGIGRLHLPLSIRVNPCDPWSNRLRSNRAFALVITVTLLAFLLLVLVGLATFTRVETSVSDNALKQAQARQNALMGLNVALGQLQKHAGPDQRVTATAEAFGGVAGTKHYTGVWDATATGPAATTWLVSGSESGPITPATAPADAVELVGLNTSGLANDVVVAKQAIKADGVPGLPAGTTVGHYAWWVGDQGVKADVTLAGDISKITYAPFDSAELNRRIRQQIGLGAGAADTSGKPVFEPRDAANAALVSKVVAPAQLALLNNAAGGATVGPATVLANFPNWTFGNYAVLANTAVGGLRQDLSLKPSLLGNEFAYWSDYTNPNFMEKSSAPNTPAPLPAYGADPLRRRYKITPAVTGTNPGVAPVLTYFYLLLGVRKANAASPYTLGLRWAAALWNPYASALVPEDLRLEITGLPTAVAIKARAAAAAAGSGATDVTVSLATLYGSPLKVKLPWDYTTTQTPDRESWLPGRTYNWVSTADAAFASGSTNAGRFYSRSIPALASGLVVSVNGSSSVNGNSFLSLGVGAQTTLTVRLLRDSDGKLLATYTSPTYQVVGTTDEFQASGNTSPLGFLFRLTESLDTIASDPSAWLTTSGFDPRRDAVAATALTTSPKSTNPTDCKNYVTISMPERLFDRDVTTGTSYNEDVPLFELPRAPILSAGELQHFYLAGARAFSLGNSWGKTATLNGVRGNEVFDRFFFSGLAGAVSPDLTAGQPLPNPLLRVLPRKPDATGVALADLKTAGGQLSSKYLLQAGAFNFNSLSAPAWMAALRAGRFLTTEAFTYLDQDPATGSAADASTASAHPAGATFFRFAQSAQEDYKADDAYTQTTTNPGGAGGPVTNVPLFRRGLRQLSSDHQVAALAQAIVSLLQQKQAASGPYRSVEEFLNPSPLFISAVGSGRQISLLERAIEVAGLNTKTALGLGTTDPEFSSQWLTQGDIMTALAPVLFPRSDTFILRAYGETVNPATAARESTAWCEAVVQRLPEPMQAAVVANPTDTEYQTPPGLLGRRFKLISFRWLTPSDI